MKNQRTGGKTFIMKAISLLLAIYIFNFSIDSRDANPDSLQEDLSFNDVESFYEFLLEDALGFENAVEEHDERDQEDGGAVEYKQVYISAIAFPIQDFLAVLKQVEFPDFPDDRLVTSFFEIDSPPPKG
jgi:hypothetical protein